MGCSRHVCQAQPAINLCTALQPAICANLKHLFMKKTFLRMLLVIMVLLLEFFAFRSLVTAAYRGINDDVVHSATTEQNLRP